MYWQSGWLFVLLCCWAVVNFESTAGGRIIINISPPKYYQWRHRINFGQMWCFLFQKIYGGGTKHINVLWTTLAREIDLWFDAACRLSILRTNDSHFSLFGKKKKRIQAYEEKRGGCLQTFPFASLLMANMLLGLQIIKTVFHQMQFSSSEKSQTTIHSS